jgi:hypothetical protein
MGTYRPMIARENPRFSNGNAAAPSCVDMNRKTRPRPALRERDARFRRAVRSAPVALALIDGSPGKRGFGGPRLRAGWRRKTPAWTGFGLTI